MFTRGSWGEKILHHLIVGMIWRVALGVYGRGVKGVMQTNTT